MNASTQTTSLGNLLRAKLNPTTITVTYAVKVEYQNVTIAEWDLIHAIYNTTNRDGTGVNKINAIKFIRMQYSLGLKEAKDICDAIGKAKRDMDANGFVIRGA